MEHQHQQSGALHGSALDTPSVGTPLEGPSQRGVLRERSANWPHDNTASPLTNTQQVLLKVSRIESPTENAYSQQATAVGDYFTGSLHAQHIGLAGCGVERSERQIAKDIKRLYTLLARCERYQKYREKQPVLTPQQFIEREAEEARLKAEREKLEAKMEIVKEKKTQETSVWPEFLEHAFWRALIRWPPMGRKKFMLDGALRGRNELIQDSIYQDTGIRRDRKQVSSHIQVLKPHVKEQPGVLVYMSTPDDDKKRHRGREAASSCHLSRLGGRHHLQQRMGADIKHEYSAAAALWSGLLRSSLGLGLNVTTEIAPYTVTDFTMLIEDEGGDHPVHDFTRLSRDGRQQDLHVTDTTIWNRQYPEFAFLQKQADKWTRKCQKVLVCDASIKVMTEKRPYAHLLIDLDLQSSRDLRPFDSLVCTTRFYDDGVMDPDPLFDGSQQSHDLKEHRSTCQYFPDPHGATGKLKLGLGSRFWVNRMSKYQSLRHKNGGLVGRSLMKLTATQDVYGVDPSGAAECLLTVLWRFRQTRDSAEVGVMKWRAIAFGAPQMELKQEWTEAEPLSEIDSDLLDTINATCTETSTIQHTEAPYAHVLIDQEHHHQQQQLPLQHHTPYAYPAPSQTPPLHLPTATDHSFPPLPHLSHSQDTAASGYDLNEFDFTGGRIDISGAFSPTMLAAAYEESAGAFQGGGGEVLGMDMSSHAHAVGGGVGVGISGLGGVEHQALLDMGLSAQDIAGMGGEIGGLSALGAYGGGGKSSEVNGVDGEWAAGLLESTGAPPLLSPGAAEGAYGMSWNPRGSMGAAAGGHEEMHAQHQQAMMHRQQPDQHAGHQQHHQHSLAQHQQHSHAHQHPHHHQTLHHSANQHQHFQDPADRVVDNYLTAASANLAPNLWNLASPFHEDSSSGAATHLMSLHSSSLHSNTTNHSTGNMHCGSSAEPNVGSTGMNGPTERKDSMQALWGRI
ncbi:hypothetical protein G6514_010307 [Epicoccum nigrum]|nr:hypothetical protein G6514_010307 [Epicoccum nigrum]